jgi:hypothetical protein
MSMKIKPVQGVSPEQLAALNKWAADYRTALPTIERMVGTAKEIHARTVAAPIWRVAEGSPEAGQEPMPELKWDIGAPKVNYVDHIDVSTDSPESVNDEGTEE